MKVGDKVQIQTHWADSDTWEWLPYVWTIMDVLPANQDRGELFVIENESGERRERPRSWLRLVRDTDDA